MKNLTRYVTSVLTLALAGWLGTALITPAQAGVVCPGTVGATVSGLAGNATDCNLFITFNADGSINTTAGPQTTYDGVEDALIGVVNNSGHTLTSISLNGGTNDIFGFDGDGIDLYEAILQGSSPQVSGNPDNSGYGGPLGYFTNISGNLGTVNFFNGVMNGQTTYFSLEEPASLNLQVSNNVPEPPVLAMFGLGLLGLGLLARRRKSA